MIMGSKYNINPLVLGSDYYVLAEQSGLLIPPLRLNSVAVVLPAFNIGVSMSFRSAIGHAHVGLPAMEICLSIPVTPVSQSVPTGSMELGLSMGIGEAFLVRHVQMAPLSIGLSSELGNVDQSIALPSVEIRLELDTTVIQSITFQPFSLGLTMGFGEASSFETGSAIIRYFCILTGAANGTTDLVLPMSSFQARRRSGDPTYLRVVIPTVDYADEIAARANGTLKIQQAYEQNGVIKQTETIMETDLEEVNPDEGGTNQSTTLVGYSTTTYSSKSITLSGTTYRSTRGGKYNYRPAKPYIFLNPGDTVTFADDGVTFVIDTMSYFINPTTSTIELAST